MSFFDNRCMVEPIPQRPIIFLSQMPDWTSKVIYKSIVKKNQIIPSRKFPLGARIIGMIFGLIIGSICLWVNINMFYNIEDLIDILVIIITFLGFVFPFIVLIINCIQNPNRDFVFDRLKGTLTMPANWLMWNNRRVTIPLEKVRYLIRPGAGPFGGATIKVIFPKYKNSSHLLNITFGSHGMNEIKQLSNQLIRSELSAINWFMDRNRPLPPGILFDPYREEDYLRRKAEGFPPPLYESYVDTPEWEGAITKYKDKEAKIRNQTIYKGSGKPGVPYDAL